MPATILKLEDGSQTIEGEYTLDEAKGKTVEYLKALCSASILAAAPQHKQVNAANGLLTEAEATAIRNAIQTRRTACNVIEAQIAAATTFAELDACPQWSEPG